MRCRTLILGPAAMGPICTNKSCEVEKASQRVPARDDGREGGESAPRARAPTPHSAGCG